MLNSLIFHNQFSTQSIATYFQLEIADATYLQMPKLPYWLCCNVDLLNLKLRGKIIAKFRATMKYENSCGNR